LGEVFDFGGLLFGFLLDAYRAEALKEGNHLAHQMDRGAAVNWHYQGRQVLASSSGLRTTPR
jgi:hypothetical protein